ncbi:YolD-like family protein [Paenibacillus yanchengensis]|uniref:YolD-like family protein n=1 Tax=Paenibacillus yanchengensis TaxID=2035833 RepID=A0ABW4YKH1_9BACL
MANIVPKPSKKYKTKRPTRDEFVLEELGEMLLEAKNEETKVDLTVWNEDEKVTGIIVNMDSRTQRVHVSTYDGVVKVPFLDIMKVDNAE